VVLKRKLAFANFCRTLNGKNGIELGGMVLGLCIPILVDEDEDEDENGDMAAERIMMELLVQSILPKLTRLKILLAGTRGAARPIIPFFSSSIRLPSTPTIVILHLNLEDYSQIHLILPLFPHLCQFTLALPTKLIVTQLDSEAPVTLSSATIQPRQLDFLSIKANFNVPSVCSILASIESQQTWLFGRGFQKALPAIRNCERMKNLLVSSEDALEDGVDHGKRLLEFTTVSDLNICRRINVGRTFFTDLFKSNPGLKRLALCTSFPLVASDLISAIKTNPIFGLALMLNNVDLDECEEGDDLEEFHWPDGCQAEDVRTIMACGEVAGMGITGSAVEIVHRLDKARREYAESLFRESLEDGDDDEDDDEDEEEEEEAEEDDEEDEDENSD
jgi:hypothetical protein